MSLLPNDGQGIRIISIRSALVPMAPLLTASDEDIVILDVRIPTQR